MIETTANGVILTVYVQPKASKTEFVGMHGDALKFRVAAPPVEGAANEALCEHLAKLFSVSKSSVEVLAGKRNRRKRVELSGVTLPLAKEILKI
jgi:uncharacterized protein (TIGR00251 family)